MAFKLQIPGAHAVPKPAGPTLPTGPQSGPAGPDLSRIASTDAQSATMSQTVPKPNPAFTLKLKNAKRAADERAMAKAAQKPVAESHPGRDALWGLGFTKREVERADKAAKRQQDMATQTAPTRDTPTPTPTHAASPAVLQDHDLPDTITPQGLTFDPSQQGAIDGLSVQKYGCIVGAAGTGKSTATRGLIAKLEASLPEIDLNSARVPGRQSAHYDAALAICFCAYTGIATQNIKRSIPKSYHAVTDTIHATLGYSPVEEEYVDSEGDVQMRRIFRPTFTAERKLPYKICIVDEAGMVPPPLWNELIAALPDDCRIYLLGDINQLQPVHGRSVLGYAMATWPTFELQHIHRTDNRGIIDNAHKILAGKMPSQDDGKQFILLDAPASGLEAYRKTLGVIQRLHKNGSFNPMRDAFIVPQNIGTVGQVHFNETLVQYFNPTVSQDGIPLNPRIVIRAGYESRVFAIGDKVMITKNMREYGLTNGMMGVIESITQNAAFRGAQHKLTEEDMADLANFDATDEGLLEAEADEAQEQSKDDAERQASHIITIRFQNLAEPVSFATAGGVNKLSHAYAVTCHKAQGAEFHTVVVLCHSSNLRMLSREWLYTAVTRAKERVILVTNIKGLNQALRTQRIKGSTLGEKIQSFIELEMQNARQANAKDTDDDDDGNGAIQPILPRPELVEHDTNEE